MGELIVYYIHIHNILTTNLVGINRDLDITCFNVKCSNARVLCKVSSKLQVKFHQKEQNTFKQHIAEVSLIEPHINIATMSVGMDTFMNNNLQKFLWDIIKLHIWA